MELHDIKGKQAIVEQSKIYGVIGEQLADNLQDFKKQIAKQKSEGNYDDILKLINDAQSLVYQASGKQAEIEEMN